MKYVVLVALRGVGVYPKTCADLYSARRYRDMIISRYGDVVVGIYKLVDWRLDV